MVSWTWSSRSQRSDCSPLFVCFCFSPPNTLFFVTDHTSSSNWPSYTDMAYSPHSRNTLAQNLRRSSHMIGKLRILVDLRKINHLNSDIYSHPVTTHWCCLTLGRTKTLLQTGLFRGISLHTDSKTALIRAVGIQLCYSHNCFHTFGTRPQSGIFPIFKLHDRILLKLLELFACTLMLPATFIMIF